jgi:hypothetical protein
MELNYSLVTLLSAWLHCWVTSIVSLLRYREILICDIAPSLRLLVPSSPQVRRPSADANRHHLHSKMPLDPVGMIRRFWRASVRSLSSCSLLIPARSRRSGGAAATARTVRQVTRRWTPTLRSSAASSYAVCVLSPLISSSKALSPEMTGSTALPIQLPPVPIALCRPRPRWHRRCRLFSHWHHILAGRSPWHPTSTVAW